jgi:hypothetical protein
MYRRPRFLEELHAIREEMARQCDYDMDLFAEMVRRGTSPTHGPVRVIRGQRFTLPPHAPVNNEPTEEGADNSADSATGD